MADRRSRVIIRMIVEVLLYQVGRAAWRTLRARLHPDPITATVSIDRLGVYTLVRRRRAQA